MPEKRAISNIIKLFVVSLRYHWSNFRNNVLAIKVLNTLRQYSITHASIIHV